MQFQMITQAISIEKDLSQVLHAKDNNFDLNEIHHLIFISENYVKIISQGILFLLI